MIRALSLTAACVVLAACASLEFADYNPNKPVGVRYYEAVPHVVVGCGQQGATFTVVALPDTTHVRTVRPGRGLGSAKLNATFQNGMISGFTQDTSPQLQETGTFLGALAGFAFMEKAGEPNIPCDQSKIGLYTIQSDENGNAVGLTRVWP